MKKTVFKVRLRPYNHRHNAEFEEQLVQVIQRAPIGSEIHITFTRRFKIVLDNYRKR